MSSTARRAPAATWPERGSVGLEPQHHFVHVAPAPILARLGGADDRVPDGLEVRRRVLALGVVAAADVAAGLAHPQMDPPHPERQALFTALHVLRDIEELDGIEMRTLGRHWVGTNRP